MDELVAGKVGRQRPAILSRAFPNAFFLSLRCCSFSSRHASPFASSQSFEALGRVLEMSSAVWSGLRARGRALAPRRVAALAPGARRDPRRSRPPVASGDPTSESVILGDGTIAASRTTESARGDRERRRDLVHLGRHERHRGARRGRERGRVLALGAIETRATRRPTSAALLCSRGRVRLRLERGERRGVGLSTATAARDWTVKVDATTRVAWSTFALSKSAVARSVSDSTQALKGSRRCSTAMVYRSGGD